MNGDASAAMPAVVHLKFLIFDWSLPNVIFGAVLIVAFFLAAWARLPRWIERGKSETRGER